MLPVGLKTLSAPCFLQPHGHQMRRTSPLPALPSRINGQLEAGVGLGDLPMPARSALAPGSLKADARPFRAIGAARPLELRAR